MTDGVWGKAVAGTAWGLLPPRPPELTLSGNRAAPLRYASKGSALGSSSRVLRLYEGAAALQCQYARLCPQACPQGPRKGTHAAPAGACSAADGCGGAGAGSPFATALRSGAGLSNAAPLWLLARPCARREKPRQAPAARCSIAYTGCRACSVTHNLAARGAWFPHTSEG